MWHRINLRIRIYVILFALIAITLGGGLVMVWYTYQMQALLQHITEKNLAAFQATEGLETALINQKGFVSYYFLEGDPSWLKRLEKYRHRFRKRLSQAKKRTDSEQEKKALETIEAEYNRYVTTKDKVIHHYKAGARKSGAALHEEVRQHFFRILELTEEFKNQQLQKIQNARQKNQDQAAHLRIIAWSAVFAVLLLGVLLALVLTTQILVPVRKLALKADREKKTSHTPVDEVAALSQGLNDLIENIDHSQSELEKSQEVLLHAEKLTLVGKLAAETAHSIRNPLTSVKMRLFSLARRLELPPNQKEDLNVITEEINHIDTIVENFLEFSRPPKLRKQYISPSDIIDLAIKLLRQRLETCRVQVKMERKDLLPPIKADPEQFKEALLNILLNACEAMQDGGFIVISEKIEPNIQHGESIVIRISDNGPGIAKSIQNVIFQPFFTTKDDGTGLGLSIAVQIIKQHGGSLTLISEKNEGAVFVISIPIEEERLE